MTEAIKYKTCRAHAGYLIHAVKVRESDPTKVGALAFCGKNANESRRPVWYIDGRAITCTNCLIVIAKLHAANHPTEQVEAK
jgi:hypothetical protein